MDKNEQIILGALQKEPLGLTIEETSQKLNIHRITASKYLAILEVRGFIKYKVVGKAKLYYAVRKR